MQRKTPPKRGGWSEYRRTSAGRSTNLLNLSQRPGRGLRRGAHQRPLGRRFDESVAPSAVTGHLPLRQSGFPRPPTQLSIRSGAQRIWCSHSSWDRRPSWRQCSPTVPQGRAPEDDIMDEPELVPCPECGGTGKVPLHLDNLPGPSPPLQIDCPTCGGTGLVRNPIPDPPP
jgi:hypothetical protein